MNQNTLNEAIDFVKNRKGVSIDIENKVIVVPFSSDMSEEVLMGKGMIGEWFEQNGFNISFERRDVEYTTKPRWINRKGMSMSDGHKAFLRNRLVMTATWE